MIVAPALKAFLDLTAFSEGTSTSPVTQNDGYDVIVSGVDGPSIFTDYSDHPFAGGRPPVLVRPGPPPLYSTAAGRYQLLFRWWAPYKAMLNLPDFTPQSQDAVALQQIKERSGIALIIAGNIQGAISACSNIWASLPGNDYGQGGKSMGELLEKYQEFNS
jgi:muramidase (phage lysozyme)